MVFLGIYPFRFFVKIAQDPWLCWSLWWIHFVNKILIQFVAWALCEIHQPWPNKEESGRVSLWGTMESVRVHKPYNYAKRERTLNFCRFQWKFDEIWTLKVACYSFSETQLHALRDSIWRHFFLRMEYLTPSSRKSRKRHWNLARRNRSWCTINILHHEWTKSWRSWWALPV